VGSGVALSDGIPSVRSYREVLESGIFKEMEVFSNRFLSENHVALRSYTKKWVRDPLHQWSRQWEYPFVFNKVQQAIVSQPTPRMLDAGSGITFFPFFLKSKFDAADVHCCDCDTMLSNIYEAINARQEKRVKFSTSDLRALPFGEGTFHLIYCISVLEHIDDYEAIIGEFDRVLAPGGVLIVTFDVSLDGTREMEPGKAIMLMEALVKRFTPHKDISLDFSSLVTGPGVFTTLTARDIDPALLPWKGSTFLHRVKSLIRTGRFGPWPPPLTVFCLGLTKRDG